MKSDISEKIKETFSANFIKNMIEHETKILYYYYIEHLENNLYMINFIKDDYNKKGHNYQIIAVDVNKNKNKPKLIIKKDTFSIKVKEKYDDNFFDFLTGI